MSKRTITRTFVWSLIALPAGFVLLVVAGSLAYAQGSFVMNGPDVVGVRSTPFGWAMVALAALGVLVLLGAMGGQFVAWIGAVINTWQLADKTWFFVLLILGLMSFGFIAMIVYVLAGPDDPQPLPSTTVRGRIGSRPGFPESRRNRARVCTIRRLVMITALTRYRAAAWIGWLIAALLLLPAGNGVLFGVLVPVSAALVALAVGPIGRSGWRRADRGDLAAVLMLYLVIVALFALAFRYFTQERTLGLFLCFAAGLLLGVAGPVVYTVWLRSRPLADLGLTRQGWRPAAALGLVLAAVQFALTLYGYALPAPVAWVPLAALALVVGLFEAVFFRGFIQTRLVDSFGALPGVGGAAALYALYHVGYGMGAREMVFLFGLGVVYAVAYACVNNILVLWPLLGPMGSFYSNLNGGDITMPWAAILGFADILCLMVTMIWLARRHQRRSSVTDATSLASEVRVPSLR